MNILSPFFKLDLKIHTYLYIFVCVCVCAKYSIKIPRYWFNCLKQKSWPICQNKSYLIRKLNLPIFINKIKISNDQCFTVLWSDNFYCQVEEKRDTGKTNSLLKTIETTYLDSGCSQLANPRSTPPSVFRVPPRFLR